MLSTAHNLWTFTWFVHFELPFRLKGTEKIKRLSKFPSNTYSILCVQYTYILHNAKRDGTPNKWYLYNETYVILFPLLLLMWTHHECKFYRIEFESKNPINKPQFNNHNFIPGYIWFTCILLLDTPALINLEL